MAEDFDAIDPFPNVHALFLHYNRLYFDEQLGACSVEWSSSRMTLCAGICQYERGGGCRIKLSEPLLKFRPSIELKETLLHEMIHAWMFLCKITDQGDHGPRFQAKMHFINEAVLSDQERPSQGYNITVCHSMHAEVDQYRTHHWQCPKCQNIVKRAMNRPPQEADCRGRQGKGSDCKDNKCAYHMHQRFCGGDYVKIAEPKDYGKKNKAKTAFADGTTVPAKRARVSNTAEPDAPRSSRQHRSITDFFNSISPTRAPESSSTAPPAHTVHDANLKPSCNAAMHSVAAPSTTDADVLHKDDAGKQAASSAGLRAQAQHGASASMQQSCASTGTQPSPQSLRQVLAHAAMQRAAHQTAADSGSGSHQLQGDITDETTLQNDAGSSMQQCRPEQVPPAIQ